jgi:hypothetical protein
VGTYTLESPTCMAELADAGPEQHKADTAADNAGTFVTTAVPQTRCTWEIDALDHSLRSRKSSKTEWPKVFFPFPRNEPLDNLGATRAV